MKTEIEWVQLTISPWIMQRVLYFNIIRENCKTVSNFGFMQPISIGLCSAAHLALEIRAFQFNGFSALPCTRTLCLSSYPPRIFRSVLMLQK